MAHILFVCTANICRSPVAAALLQKRLEQRGLDQWQVHSAGTWVEFKRRAARYSIAVMAERGYDIMQHRSHGVTDADLKWADLVLCMEKGHVEALRIEFPQQAEKIFLLSEMVGQKYSIDDPYGGPVANFRKMADELTELIDGGLDRIIELAGKHAKKRP